MVALGLSEVVRVAHDLILRHLVHLAAVGRKVSRVVHGHLTTLVLLSVEVHVPARVQQVVPSIILSRGAEVDLLLTDVDLVAQLSCASSQS